MKEKVCNIDVLYFEVGYMVRLIFGIGNSVSMLFLY